MNRRLQANTILHLNKSMSQILVHSLTKTGLLPSYCYLALPYLFLSLSSSYSNIRSGVPYRIRTCDLLLRRQLLYPAELRRHILVLGAGIEPARAQGPQDFKSGVSTYSTTRAFILLWYKYN